MIDIKSNFLFHLTIKILTFVIAFPFSQSTFKVTMIEVTENQPQVRCVISVPNQQELVALTQPSRTYLRGCQDDKPLIGFCVPFDREIY